MREIDNTIIVGAVILDFSAAFDIIDQSAAGKMYVLWLYTPWYNVDKELLVQQNTEGVL